MVVTEWTRALVAVVLLPLRIGGFLICRDGWRGQIRRDIAGCAPAPWAPAPPPAGASGLGERPLCIFVSCAESSGEIHAVNLVRALLEEVERAGGPRPRLLGFGSDRLARLGVEIVAEPVARAAMGLGSVLSELPYYTSLLGIAARTFREARPDLFLPVDSPALHVPLAHIARRYAIPTVHFVTPQYWGWAPWRVRGYRRAVDRALTILPFEPAWFERQGVAAAHVGHPLLDELEGVPATTPPADARVLVLLPGSRSAVIDRNLPWMLRVAGALRASCPEAELRIVQGDDRHRGRIETHLAASGVDAALETDDLHGSLARARAALSVSGTVLIDLLHHRLPAVVVYRLNGRRGRWMFEHLLSTPHFASVNLLAGREVLPEFCFTGKGPVEAVGQALERCYKDEAWRAYCGAGLERAARRLGPAGASRRAALHALEVALGKSREGAPRPDEERLRG